MNEVQAELAQFKRDTAYYEAHQEELLEQYPEQWVAIFNQQVVGVAIDARQLLTDLKERGIPVGKVLVEHLTRRDELWILHP